LDAVELTEIGTPKLVSRLYCALDEALVVAFKEDVALPVEREGSELSKTVAVDAALLVSTMMVPVDVAVRPIRLRKGFD
jgi:hypothetical protein